ncbi:cytochrome C oxidase subunit IV family protein [Aquisediminimonas sediminicola]|uniref:cytochrome C oxidase subunit IV family protein n=1 Tax=Alteraquisediminimonas sediminicola TaxID=2676787 RepID=UPI001C8D568D|nr:cytochrome C oxidase subunit IV family protein [Aquisediminimonas sediminicola]
MNRILHLSPVKVWALLVAVTLISWVLTEDSDAVRFGATAVILIAAFKINMVIGHFMELQWTPRPFRIVLSLWLILVTTIIIGCYWYV